MVQNMCSQQELDELIRLGLNQNGFDINKGTLIGGQKTREG